MEVEGSRRSGSECIVVSSGCLFRLGISMVYEGKRDYIYTEVSDILHPDG